MSKEQKFCEGVKFLSIIYAGKFNGQPFDRVAVKSAVSILKKTGFKHTTNEGTLAVLSIIIGNVTYTVHIGKQEDESFFQLYTTEQSVLSI